ncbi:Holliday junction branch migration protein RuvA [Flavimaricola marinus]|uniref:Holliday junction branch migration complex subunit RuvA n=1 Tax=Flavimaricola marinus TaxID=1819565 RepID=A0A238LCG7_9RHOB|nr:Holliday junction branch migration protein RuvA [Flavimaricola marinus]SMY06620.1 Holliday junction ATP-dependent DNA helicase RuvA [Flavimaricola marinus]
MIGKLSGRIDYRATDHVLIDVRGVGYVVYVSDRVMAALPGVGEAAALYTDLLVREDILQLFGFLTLAEKEWHRLLTSVQGIGAKGSLAILGALGPDGVGKAIALGDWSALAKAKGVGPKTAQRVVMELKDKAPSMMAMVGGAASVTDVPDEPVVEPSPQPVSRPKAAAAAAQSSAQADALSALQNLGYGPSEAVGAVAQAASDAPDAEAAALIRAALKLLAPKG